MSDKYSPATYYDPETCRGWIFRTGHDGTRRLATETNWFKPGGYIRSRIDGEQIRRRGDFGQTASWPVCAENDVAAISRGLAAEFNAREITPDEFERLTP